MELVNEIIAKLREIYDYFINLCYALIKNNKALKNKLDFCI